MGNSDEHEMSCSELLQAQALVWNFSVIYVKSLSLKCAIELGIPDIIHSHGQTITLSKLIESLPIHRSKSHCIHRLMRLLAHSGFFVKQTQKQEEKYSLTPASRLLLKQGPFRATTTFLNQFEEKYFNPGLFLSTWFQNSDETPFYTMHGTNLWQVMFQDQELRRKFYDEMEDDSRLIAKVIVEECEEVFKGVESLIDVGGGTGTVTKAIANAFPHIRCTVFDLPHVVAEQGTDHDHNLNFVGGNMFEALPPANAILLKWILHDWKDEECVTILKHCREAIPSKEEGGKLIIIEMIIEDSNIDKERTETQLCWDMMMMAGGGGGGQERNKMAWEKLFLAAGFGDYKITHLGLRSLIEVYP
ncbi:hypothetical protein FNV43_RR13743 [Rhamnella rubrinervis]|uniref:Uncharacterized protein n=1 Tax=Rhamnella rubrinervis TaxID=2594499 RepID=A0A8K0MFQ6_9ROSA|nr:hypothetical protein FNV43_RR13743 [Rhamnella rubrinervis]